MEKRSKWAGLRLLKKQTQVSLLGGYKFNRNCQYSGEFSFSIKGDKRLKEKKSVSIYLYVTNMKGNNNNLMIIRRGDVDGRGLMEKRHVESTYMGGRLFQTK